MFVNILYSTLRSFNLPLIVPNSLSDQTHPMGRTIWMNHLYFSIERVALGNTFFKFITDISLIFFIVPPDDGVYIGYRTMRAAQYFENLCGPIRFHLWKLHTPATQSTDSARYL